MIPLDPLKDKILADIQKTGFVTELKTVSVLNGLDWNTTHSSTYEDLDHNVSREIDVVATKVDYIKSLGFRLNFNLVIEVKKTNRPWIVFSTENRFAMTGWRFMNNTKNCHIQRENELFPFSVFGPEDIDKNNPRENTWRTGKAFHEFTKEPHDKSKIYDALISVCKAAYYFKNQYVDGQEVKNFIPDMESEVSIFLPVVVVDTRLFEAYNTSNSEIELDEKDYIPVEMNYSSPKYREGLWEVNFLPDIVTVNGFSNYLNKIEEWRKNCLKSFILRMQEIGKKPDPRWFGVG